jgi:DNA polymerase III sliding clamp (beta) subunit (PCNA family)
MSGSDGRMAHLLLRLLILKSDTLAMVATDGHRLLISRILTGQFPNYEVVLPRETVRPSF